MNLQIFPKLSQATIPSWLSEKGWQSAGSEVATVLLSVGILAGLAQVSIPLPWTPVPITGQTFGVTLIALLLGRRLGFTAVSCYLLLGAWGAPVFASGKSGLIIGPTFGYLAGMWFSSWIVGGLSDRGWSRSFFRAWAAGALGSVAVFSCGLLGLSLFIPKTALLGAGLLPFLPGDLVKTLLAASVASRSYKKSAQ